MSLIKKFSLILISVLLPLLAAGSLYAQKPYVSVRLTPVNTDWDWQSYARGLTAAFEQTIESRVREGLPRREFELIKDTLELKYFFRLDLEGNFRRFAPLSPEHRYLSYLVQRTARELPPPGPLPEDFPSFKFDGELTFKLGFVPTGRYKRLYFEQPLDSLELPGFEPQIVVRGNDVLLLYEPPDLDKNKLLEDYRRRLGLRGEMTDTSSFTPLDFRDMYLALQLPYDSLYFGLRDTSALRDSLHAALEREGARLLHDLPIIEYSTPVKSSAPEDSTAQDDSTMDGTKNLQPMAEDSLLPAIPGAADQDSSLQNDTTQAGKAVDKAEPAVRDTLLPARDLPEAFRKVVDIRRAFVLSVALTQDSLPGRALCRLKLFLAEQPEKLKRRVDYRFALRDSLPDTLGRALVNRLVRPPERPKPPEPPKPKTPPAATADSTRPALSDSARALADSLKPAATTAQPSVTPGDSTAPAPAASPAAPADSSTRTVPDSSAAAPTAPAVSAPDSPAPQAPPDTLQQAPDSTAPAAPAAPPDTGSTAPQQSAPVVPPADNSQTAPQASADTTGTATPNP